LAVYEKGSYLQRMRDRGRRVLVPGSVLTGLLDSFKAIFAHEYGHFQNRDTVGGDALRCQSAR
jgi:Zn-dependent protease with chaperone function